MLVILSGVSGSGKDTVKAELLNRINNLTTIKAYTTREPRDEDEDLSRYFFVSKEEFQDLISGERLYEYSEHHNNFYGTSKNELDRNISEGKIVIKDIDVNGTKDLIDVFREGLKVVPIYLKVEKDELYKRIINRGATKEEADLRLSRFEYEESFIPIYDYVVYNDNLEKTVNIIEKIILEEYKLSKE